MEFKEFRNVMQKHVATMFETDSKLFIADVDKDELWDLYLDSFPRGTNEIFRERREHDCSCCKHFVRAFGAVVIIKDNKLTSIWDFDAGNQYRPVVVALSRFVKSAKIKDVFVTKETGFGVEKTFEQLEGEVRTWDHFRISLPKKHITKSSLSEASIAGDYREVRGVFQRSLTELTKDSIDTVLDLISQKSLYKGEEWKPALDKFLALHIEYSKLPEAEKDNYCWAKSVEVGPALAKIKNHSIGVLLSDIASGMDLNDAVKRYEEIVAPSNYKRPKAIFTKKMVEDAEKTISELGLGNSLERRHAVLDDITINNILFANKDTHKKLGSVFDDLKKESVVVPKTFDRIEEVSIETFVSDILPKAETIELLFENKHSTSLMSLIAPKDLDAKSILKWNNNFSWAYAGNMTDSMKELVKAAGGNVEGVLRFSLQWNEDGDNHNDYDAHCIEPRGNTIYFSRKRNDATTGVLDVDIMHPSEKVAVENITWSNIDKMQEGRYQFYVHNFSHRGGRSGFAAEIEYGGQIYSYEYRKDIKQNEKILVAELKFGRKKGIEFVKSLDSQLSSKTVWGLKTNQFHPVSVMMYSPNYWDEQSGIGHRHYFFIMNCNNEESPNGFFNEFLNEELMKHKRVFEALGSKMRVEPSDQQLSGLGFSSTKRNSVVCKVTGNFTRIIKINF